MFKHILIPTDGSELSYKAVKSGVAFARSIGARVTFLTSSTPFHLVAVAPTMVTSTREHYHQEAEAVARKLLQQAEDDARGAGIQCDSVHVFGERPYEAIIEATNTRGCDLILMASHGRKGLSSLLLGSETQKVLAHCKIPTLVWR